MFARFREVEQCEFGDNEALASTTNVRHNPLCHEGSNYKLRQIKNSPAQLIWLRSGERAWERASMWLYYFAYYFGSFLAVVVIGVLGTLAACWCCGVSVDSLLTWGEGRATLTCFHCGQQTQADRKTCQHCGRELQ